MSRQNQNLTPAEAAVWRQTAAYHGLTAATGPHVGQGSVRALQMSITAGDAQIVMLDPDELAAVVPWLNAQAGALPDGALRDALLGIAYGLAHYLPTPSNPAPASAGEAGPINTLDG